VFPTVWHVASHAQKKWVGSNLMEIQNIKRWKLIAVCVLHVCYPLAVVFVLLLLFPRQETQVPRMSPNGPSREQLQQWFDEHPTQAPPAEWYQNGDPWRGITAEEANAMLEDCEVKK
jgi:hypothetical protein